MSRTSVAIGFLLAFALAASWAANAREQQGDSDVIATERAAIERWGKGDPDGFLTTYAPEITYFDPTEERRVDGLPAMTALLTPLRGKIHIDRFDMLNPKVQRHGDIAVLTYNVVNYQKQPDGTERQMPRRWNSTAVFLHIDGKWRTIHSHFSYTKPDVK
jgi:ketosteroid isomerase-like protein